MSSGIFGIPVGGLLGGTDLLGNAIPSPRDIATLQQAQQVQQMQQMQQGAQQPTGQMGILDRVATDPFFNLGASLMQQAGGTTGAVGNALQQFSQGTAARMQQDRASRREEIKAEMDQRKQVLAEKKIAAEIKKIEREAKVKGLQTFQGVTSNGTLGVSVVDPASGQVVSQVDTGFQPKQAGGNTNVSLSVGGKQFEKTASTEQAKDFVQQANASQNITDKLAMLEQINALAPDGITAEILASPFGPAIAQISDSFGFEATGSDKQIAAREFARQASDLGTMMLERLKGTPSDRDLAEILKASIKLTDSVEGRALGIRNMQIVNKLINQRQAKVSELIRSGVSPTEAPFLAAKGFPVPTDVFSSLKIEKGVGQTKQSTGSSQTNEDLDYGSMPDEELLGGF